MSVGNNMWVVSYVFAGATGIWAEVEDKWEAEEAADACERHFLGIARISVEYRG